MITNFIKKAPSLFSAGMAFELFAALISFAVFSPATLAGAASVSLERFSMVAPYVCPGEKVQVAWGMDSSDTSVNIRCLFDFNGDGITDEVIDNCPLKGYKTFAPSVTGPIKPVIKVRANGVLVAERAASGFIHSSLPTTYSGGREVIRFGKYAPSTFYATDVAIDKDGKIYVTDWLRNQVARYSGAGKNELVIRTRKMKPRRLTVDLEGRVYVTDPSHNSVHVYDQDGQEADVWDISARFGGVVGPGGIKFVAPDRILLATTYAVLVLNTNGDLVFQFGTPGKGPGQFYHVYDAATAADGSFLVVDGGNRLQKFDPSGKFVWSSGRRGSKPGNFDLPVAVSVDANGYIYVSDRKNFRIQKFDSNGKFVLQWGSEGVGPGKFFWHNGITIDPLSGNIWVAGYHGHDVQQFTPDGQLESRWRGHVTGPDEFAFAAGIAATDDKIFVVDQINQQVKAFDKTTGEPLYYFGERGEGDLTAFNFPRAIALSPSGDLYITEDRNIHEVAEDGTFISVFKSLTGNISASEGIHVYKNAMYVADTNHDKLYARSTSNGEAIWITGSNGTGPGQFERPHGVTIGTGPLVMVTDEQNRVQTFNMSGRFIRQWSTVTPGSSDVIDSLGIAFDPARQIVYVGGFGRINAYDMCGAPLFSWVPTDPWMPRDRFMAKPSFQHLAVDEDGVVFATDRYGTVYGFVPE